MVGLGSGGVGVVLLRGRERKHLDVRVRHLEPLDLYADVCMFRKDLAHFATNTLDSAHQRPVIIFGQVPNVGHGVFGYNQHLAGLNRVDVHKCVGAVVFVYLVAGNVAVDNAGKKCGCHSI